MDLINKLFALLGRLVEAAERIAAAVETIAMLQGGDDLPPSSPGAAAAPPAGAPGEAAKAPRRRRTKAEIAADEAAAATNGGHAAGVIGAVLGTPAGFAMPGFPAGGAAPFPPAVGATAMPPAAAPFPPTAAAPGVPSPMGAGFNPAAAYAAPGVPPLTAATPPQAIAPVAPPPAPSAPDLSGIAAQYTALPVDEQFTALLDLYSKYGNFTGVRDAMAHKVSEVGGSLPLSDPLDQTKPAAPYMNLTNAARWAIYEAMYLAAVAATSAG